VRAGLNVAKHITLFAGEWNAERDAIARDIEATLGYPAFVKPSNGGSSMGVSKVRSREDLADAMRAAFDLDDKVLVEEALRVREVECGVLGNESIGHVADRRDRDERRILRLQREVPGRQR
jgi:D-alanine-D-alanine ligase